MNFKHIAALDETGAQLFNHGATIHAINIYNSHATDPLYLKFFFTTTAPTYASDVPELALTIPAGITNMTVDLGVPACYVQASADIGAGATAPAADPAVTFTFVRS